MSKEDRQLTATFRFSGSLLDLLSDGDEGSPVTVHFRGRQSVKHLIEALHIPHTEVGKIRVNGGEVSLSYLVQDQDCIEVLPKYPTIGIDQRHEHKFILDNHLGKLATYMRMCGFDTWYQNDYQDDTLESLCAQSDRTLVSRDRGLLMRKAIVNGYWIRSLIPREQLKEILINFQLVDQILPFHRCLRCNYPLASVEKSAVMHRLLPLTRKYYDEFYLCQRCDQVYWPGSHYARMHEFISSLVREISHAS